MTLSVPGHLCWPVWRVAASERFSDALHTIETEWSLAMVADANDVLDAFDDAIAAAAEKG